MAAKQSPRSNVLQFKKRGHHRESIDSTERKRRHVKGLNVETGASHSAKGANGNVIPLELKRQSKQAIEKRTVARTILSQFVGVFVVLPNRGLQSVSLYDISQTGLSFDMAHEVGRFATGENVRMRIYLSHDTYFTFTVQIANVRRTAEDGQERHGTVFGQNDDCYETLFFFARFLESVSAVARKDSGDRLLGKVD